jgi:hypothetical protein
MKSKRELRVFRCYYHPADKYGNPVPMPSGNLPSVDIEAVDRDKAKSIAFATVRAPITETERLDDVTPAKQARKPRQVKPKLADLRLVTAASLLKEPK